jgi:hypothetical protein
MSGANQHHQLHSSCSHHERTYILSSQECQEQNYTISFILAPATGMTELTNCQAKNARSRSIPSASFQLQQPCQENLPPVKSIMPGADQTISFILAPVTMRELTRCQAKIARRRSTPSVSFQLQPPWQNILSVKPRMPGADQHHQLHFSCSLNEKTHSLSSQECQEEINTSSSHHERTYLLSSQECQEQINTIIFIPAAVTIRELTSCQAKNARSRSTPSTSFQLQPPGENLPTVKPRMPGADQHHQLHSSSSHHDRTYIL